MTDSVAVPDIPKSPCAAFYHDPPLWVDESPLSMQSGQTSVDFPAFADVVYESNLGPIRLKVLREGLFKFDFTDWPAGVLPPEMSVDFEATAIAVLNRTLVMNAFLALLYTKTGLQDCMVVSPALVVAMGLYDDDVNMSFGSQRVAHLAQSRYPLTYNQAIPPQLDGRLSFRSQTLPIEKLSQASEELSSLIDQDRVYFLQTADLFLRASTAFQDYNYSAALIDFWAISEHLLNQAWTRFQTDCEDRENGTFMSGSRRKRLNDGRTFTAAVITELLSFNERIPFGLYTKIGSVRKTRNEWMHGMKQPTAEDAIEAAEVCEHMLALVEGIRLTSAKGRRLHG